MLYRRTPHELIIFLLPRKIRRKNKLQQGSNKKINEKYKNTLRPHFAT